MTTLQNFGVAPSRGGILMPKIKNRFRVLVTNFGIPSGSIALTQQVMTMGRPHANFQPQTVHSYNSIAYYAGKAEWEAVSLKVRDDVTNSVSRLVGAQEQRQMNYFEQTVPMAASNYKFGMLMHTLDGGNDTVLEEWEFEGCFLATVNYDAFDYSSSDAVTIEMSIRYDNVTQSGGLMPILPSLGIGPFLT